MNMPEVSAAIMARQSKTAIIQAQFQVLKMLAVSADIAKKAKQSKAAITLTQQQKKA